MSERTTEEGLSLGFGRRKRRVGMWGPVSESESLSGEEKEKGKKINSRPREHDV